MTMSMELKFRAVVTNLVGQPFESVILNPLAESSFEWLCENVEILEVTTAWLKESDNHALAVLREAVKAIIIKVGFFPIVEMAAFKRKEVSRVDEEMESLVAPFVSAMIKFFCVVIENAPEKQQRLLNSDTDDLTGQFLNKCWDRYDLHPVKVAS